MLDRGVLRIGGASAMVGAVLAVIFNLLHPRSGDVGVLGELDLVSGSSIWLFDHFMLAWSIAFALVGIVAIGWSFLDGPSATWARFALGSALVGIAVTFITLLVDGPAMKHVADAWAKNRQDPAALATARAVAEVDLALFTGVMGSLFGLTPVLFGLTLLSSDRHPPWLAYLAFIAGTIGLISASIQYLNGISELTGNVLFPIGSVLFTIWLFVMGWRLWKEPVTTPAGDTRRAVAA